MLSPRIDHSSYYRGNQFRSKVSWEQSLTSHLMERKVKLYLFFNYDLKKFASAQLFASILLYFMLTLRFMLT